MTYLTVGLMLSHSVMPNSLQPYGLWPARLLCPWGILQARILKWVAFPPPGDLPNPGNEPTSHLSPALGFFTP